MAGAEQRFRNIPPVDRVLEALEEGPVADAPHAVRADAAREAADAARERLRSEPGAPADAESLLAWVVAAARRRVAEWMSPHYRRVINATGIILHTALGRAVLPEAALRQIDRELRGYSILQADPVTGKRCRREGPVVDLLKRITGAEAAHVVNNNAAATLLVLATVGKGRAVIVSRGQLVEIGGSYRLPDVMTASGARLVEVGTTNKTHAADYERAITEDTAAIMRVHPSNYKIYGFSEEVELAELERIAHARGLVLIDDLGAGELVNLAEYGFPREPTLPESVRTGSDLVTASGDKLIGSGQAGIILGKKKWIDAVRANPMARALRVDKMTLAALEATLRLFLDEATAMREVPTLRMLSRSVEDVAEQAGRIADRIAEAADGVVAETLDGHSQLGSGSLPTHDVPTRLVALAADGLSPDELATRLRTGEPPVFARIRNDRVLLDPRTLQPGEEPRLVEAVAAAVAEGPAV